MLAILIIFCIIAFSSARPKCLALSLEGGGSHGAFEAGALWQLVNTLPPSEVQYNVVTGISTGALNAAGVALYPIGQEKAMADFVIDTWLNLNGTSSVFKDWNGGIIDGLIFQGGWYNNEPLKKTVADRCKGGFHRNITVGSTNLDTGLFDDFNETIGNEGMITAIICSASPPGYFPPTKFQGYNWADGGCVLNLDLFAAVNRCLDVVEDEEDITLDLIFDTKDTNLTTDANMTTLHVIKRAKEIKNYDSNIWFLYNAMAAYPKVNFRYVIFPSRYMPGGYVPLDFNRTVLEWEIELGKNDTANILNSLRNEREMHRGKFNWKKDIVYPD